MRKILISVDYGGFGLSVQAMELYRQRGGTAPWDKEIPRDCPIAIGVVEELGTKDASGWAAKLAIVEIPDDVEWQIEEYDGWEHIAEKHRTWGGEL